MDKSAYTDWVAGLEAYQVIDLANDWGNQVAKYSALGGSELKKLQTFSEYLIQYYNGNVANAFYGDDEPYDNLDRSGDRE